MTVTERDELAKFLSGLHQTRLAFEDSYASSQIRETVALNPQGQYAMTMRCILLEKELAALRGQSQSPVLADGDHALTPPLTFLGATLKDWSVNARSLPKPATVGGTVAKANVPFHLLMEEKGMRFLSNNPFKVWSFILFLTFLVVHFKVGA
jgi:hypothetical protein